MESIQASPTKPYRNVAREVGLSSKTVKRRLQEMQDARALNLMFNVDLRALKGSLNADLLVLFDTSGEARKVINDVLSILGNNLYTHVGGPEFMFCHVWLFNISERNRLLS